MVEKRLVEVAFVAVSSVTLVVAKLVVPVAVRVPVVRLEVEALVEETYPVVREVKVGVADTAIVEVEERMILDPAVK